MHTQKRILACVLMLTLVAMNGCADYSTVSTSYDGLSSYDDNSYYEQQRIQELQRQREIACELQRQAQESAYYYEQQQMQELQRQQEEEQRQQQEAQYHQSQAPIASYSDDDKGITLLDVAEILLPVPKIGILRKGQKILKNLFR